MNSRPMILRFSSGSLHALERVEEVLDASTTLSATPVAATKSRSTCSASPLRSSPWSTNTQVSWSPIARCTSAAATAESTPPDRPQMACLSPTCSRIRATCSSTTLTIVQVCRQPAMSTRNRSRTLLAVLGVQHLGVPLDAGVPARDRLERRDRGRRRSTASTVKPSGAAATASPWLIQTRCSGSMPASRVPASLIWTWVRPNSETPVRRTLAAERHRHRLKAVADAEDGHVARRRCPRRAAEPPARRQTAVHR